MKSLFYLWDMNDTQTSSPSLRILELRYDTVERNMKKEREYLHANFYELKKNPELFATLRAELKQQSNELDAIADQIKERIS